MGLLINLKEQIKIAARLIFKKTPWTGNYNNWQSALNHTTGYNAGNILRKVSEATLKVKKGEVAYERDSVLFDTIQYSWPLLSYLLFIAIRNNNTLKVLDFGGSLGSSYFQNRFFLKDLSALDWNIVEQPQFVEEGQRVIKTDALHFFYSPEECIANKGLPHVLLLSSVLPYIEHPYQLLQNLMALQIPYLIIDNTFFNPQNANRITVQNVPPQIYEASYPCWFLSYEMIKSTISVEYDIIAEHLNDDTIYLDGRPVRYKGLLAKRK